MAICSPMSVDGASMAVAEVLKVVKKLDVSSVIPLVQEKC